MTQENKYREILENLVKEFAYKDDGEWWGHDTNLGDSEDAFQKAVDRLTQIALDAKREGMEEAAKICDLKAEEVHEEGITTHGLGFMFQDYKECAESIRAEKEKL